MTRKLIWIVLAVVLCLICTHELWAKKTIKNDFTKRRQYISSTFSDLTAIVTIDRIATNTTLTALHHNVFADTDSAAITVTLPAGVSGTEYRIANVGTSTNNVAIAPNGSENLIGANSNWTLFDSETLIIVYDSTEGWY